MVFCGREAEMQVLKAAWEKVSDAAPSPQVVTLVGESGLGKTRLIQEFYAWLSTEVDGFGAAGYWPDTLARNADNLSINPAPETCDGCNPMLFLWWGVRLPDPWSRNAARGGVAADVDLLKPHIGPFAEARLRRDKAQGFAKDAALEVATEVANAFTFNLAGLAKTVTEKGALAWDVYRADRAMRHQVDLGARSEKAQRDIVEMIHEDMSLLLSGNPKRGRRLPVVIVIDDAQWTHHDPSTLELVERLLVSAREADWPLLLIATHWEREWREDSRSAERSFARICQQAAAGMSTPVFLGKATDLSRMIRTALPGLSEDQRQLVLEKADGNPRLADELLRHLLGKPRFFVDRDTRNAMTDSGEREVRRASFSLHELVFERLAASAPSTRLALGLSGLQGIRFIKELTGEVGRALGKEIPSDALSEAEDPMVFLARTSSPVPEFVQRVYREVALEQLEDLLETGEAREALSAEVTRMLDRRAAAGTPEEPVLLGLAMDVLEDEAPVRALEARADLVRFKLDEGDHRGAAQLASHADDANLGALEADRIRALFDAMHVGGLHRDSLRFSGALLEIIRVSRGDYDDRFRDN
jgi:hypothetical protein